MLMYVDKHNAVVVRHALHFAWLLPYQFSYATVFALRFRTYYCRNAHEVYASANA
jgi:hypothetical protein